MHVMCIYIEEDRVCELVSHVTRHISPATCHSLHRRPQRWKTADLAEVGWSAEVPGRRNPADVLQRTAGTPMQC